MHEVKREKDETWPYSTLLFVGIRFKKPERAHTGTTSSEKAQVPHCPGRRVLSRYPHLGSRRADAVGAQ